MGRRSIDLGGSWELKGYLGADWAAAAAERGVDGPGWIAGCVPGSVVHDLWRAGEVADPYFERNSLQLEWIPERTWLYRRDLELSPLTADERALLGFEGVDYACTVFLDGAVVGRHEGMFVPFELDVTAAVRDRGRHRLVVLVERAPESEAQVGRTSRVRIHKSRMTYGWDFCPRLVHQGIWQQVTLEVVRESRIVDVRARPSPAGEDTWRLDVEITIEATSSAHGVLELKLRDGDRVIAQGPADLVGGTGVRTVSALLEVDRPRLWWSNGLGEPVVHRLVARLQDGDDVLDEREVPVGFRTVELAPNEGARADARPYTLVVNGIRTYANGWNWTPLDVFHGVPNDAALEHRLRLAADAHVNLLRVWGGGLIESDAFYDRCDRLGILVWQEFSQSSSGVESEPSRDPAFVERMQTEARAIVPARANHPSLAVWCGGNELSDERGPLDERSPGLAALADVVRELDPGRGWLPTSPTGPRFHNRLADIDADPDGLHDVHGPWEHQGLRQHNVLYDAGTSLLNSEFGVEGMANRRTFEALVSPAHRWPAGRDNPVMRHLGDWWDNGPLVQASFGGGIDDVATLRRASQQLQADGLRYAIEANRRRWPRNSGSLPWQFNESYPNAWCTAAVDHRGDPKPAYFAVRRTYEPVHVCAVFDRWVWAGEPSLRADVFAWSNAGQLSGCVVAARIVDIDGAELAVERWTGDLPADARACRFGTITLDLQRRRPALAVLDLTLSDAAASARSTNRYIVGGGDDLAPLRGLAPATLDVAVTEREADRWVIGLEHRGGPAALGVMATDDRPIDAPGWADADDGGMDILPGETRAVTVRWIEAPEDGRRLRVEGWNVDVVVE